MDAQTVTDILAEPVAQELLFSDVPARLSYIGVDGDPRVVPTAFWWTGETIVIATALKAAKVAAIRRNPRVALAVDRPGMPPRSLLVRGSATVEIVDGVPDAYVAGSRKITPAEAVPAWEAGVRALYGQMAVITITPERGAARLRDDHALGRRRPDRRPRRPALTTPPAAPGERPARVRCPTISAPVRRVTGGAASGAALPRFGGGAAEIRRRAGSRARAANPAGSHGHTTRPACGSAGHDRQCPVPSSTCSGAGRSARPSTAGRPRSRRWRRSPSYWPRVRDHRPVGAAGAGAAPGRELVELLDRRSTLARRRRLLVVGGWLASLGATLHVDLGDRVGAAGARAAAASLGRETDDREIGAWAVEVGAWTAPTDRNWERAGRLAADGEALAPVGSPAAVQLAAQSAQSARAAARLGEAAGVRGGLARAGKWVDHQTGDRPPAHRFTFDAPKLEGYTATALAWAGDRAGEDIAREVADRYALGPPRRLATARIDPG
jgi:hypothetical protein